MRRCLLYILILSVLILPCMSACKSPEYEGVVNQSKENTTGVTEQDNKTANNEDLAENEVSAFPAAEENEELTKALEMSDVELAAEYSWVNLLQQGSTYYIDPESWAAWKPEVTEGFTEATSPMMYIATTFLPYGKGDVNDVALCLTKRWLHLMMNPELPNDTTFLITAYKDLSIDVYT